MEPLLRTDNLTHVFSAGTPFQTTAIDRICFEVQEGEFVAIIGRTGSGKSTFVQHLNGLLKPTSGTVLLRGKDIHASKETARQARFQVGLVFQYPEYQLFEETVYQDIAFGPKNMGLCRHEIDERIYEAAAFAGVEEELLKKSPFELSGGQKRRVAIAGVIAMRPKVLILDEPTAGLDPAGCKSLMENLRKYHREQNASILMVTHDMAQAAQYASRLFVLYRGQAVMDGAPGEIFSKRDQLSRLGLDVPPVTALAGRLRELGVNVEEGTYEADRLVSSLLRERGMR